MSSDNNYRMPRDLRRKSMRCVFMTSIFSVAGATLLSQQVMVLLAIKAGATEIFLGSISFATLAPFALCLLALPHMESHGKKFLIMRGASLGTALIIPLVFLPQIAQYCHLYVFMLAMLIFLALRMSAEAIGFAAWFPLLQDITPSRVTGRFFGNLRTAWQTSGMISMLLAAWFLWDDRDSPPWWKFNTVFAIALLFFIVKVFFLRPIAEGPRQKNIEEQSTVIGIIKSFLSNKDQRKVLLYLLSYAVAFGMSIPFQVKFLKDIGRSDGFILVAIAMVNGGAVIALRRCGKLADRFGNRSLFTLSHAGMIVVTASWLFVQTGPYSTVLILVLFFFNSFFNSGNGIAQTRYLMHSIPTDRQRDITIINMLIIFTWGLSPLLAGLFLHATGAFKVEIMGRSFNNYHLLFVINAGLFMIPRTLRKPLKMKDDTPTVHMLATLLRPGNAMLGPFQKFIKKSD